ncbi:hypothetical protein DUNSADRAFT_9540 [Dunaliella salina]|uniref:Encoded protein n=1 Tax=Dunaliella salina TaxID=3046 RepID=A0ABQ7FTY7_DUNSA|nr:hypothetical protein DUNSADRAFT_9540 [Dunaliella salina]|eukprot:KAF5825476.1 hypothetical protein DUNSADRAFT_9540 [Dunaliella salina]
MLRAETTVSDVTFDVTSRKKEVINVRAEVWSEDPPTIQGRDTNPEHAAKPPRYQVECPERSSWGRLDPCSCDVVYWGKC